MIAVAVVAAALTQVTGRADLSEQLGVQLDWGQDCLRLEKRRHEHPWEWGRPPAWCGTCAAEMRRFDPPCGLGTCYYIEVSYGLVQAITLLAGFVLVLHVPRWFRPE